MKDFKNILKKRIMLAGLFNGLAIIFISSTAYFSKIESRSNENISDFIQGFQVGIFLGLELMTIVYIAKFIKALKDDNKLKKLYIEENDERKKLINDKIGGIGFNTMLILTATMAVISGFFNYIIFFTLLGILVLGFIIKGSLKFYYSKKI